MDRSSLETRFKDLPLGGLRYYDRTESTNSDAARWADKGAADLALVVADEQTAGRGRGGRNWITPAGSALAFSLVVRDHEKPGFASAEGPDVRLDPTSTTDIALRLQRLTALGAVGLAQALGELYDLEAEIKWPNDVLLNRRKVCGILSEAHWQGGQLGAVIVGIGINVSPAAVPSDDEVIYPATSVETVLNRRVDRIELLHEVLRKIIAWRRRLESPNFLDEWNRRLAFKGETVWVFTGIDLSAPPDIEGELTGLDENGCLQISTRSGTEHRLCTGELRLRPRE